MWWPSVLQHPRAQLMAERIEKERNQRLERNRALSMERLDQFTPRRRDTKSTTADTYSATPERRRSDMSCMSFATPSPARDHRGSVKSSTASGSSPLRDSTPQDYATPPKASKSPPALKGKVRNRDKEGLTAALAQLPEMA